MIFYAMQKERIRYESVVMKDRSRAFDNKLGISSSLIDHAVVSLDFVQSGSYETGTAYGASRRGKEEDRTKPHNRRIKK